MAKKFKERCEYLADKDEDDDVDVDHLIDSYLEDFIKEMKQQGYTLPSRTKLFNMVINS
jgi:hypothetical protein